MQLTKEVLFFPAINTIKDCLYITEYTLNHIQVKDHILEEKYQYLFQCGKCKRFGFEGRFVP